MRQSDTMTRGEIAAILDKVTRWEQDGSLPHPNARDELAELLARRTRSSIVSDSVTARRSSTFSIERSVGPRRGRNGPVSRRRSIGSRLSSAPTNRPTTMAASDGT